MLNEIALKLGITFNFHQESLETVLGLLYKFASIDGNVPEEEKDLLVKLVGGDESTYNRVALNNNSFNEDKTIELVSTMKDIDKATVGFYIQQIISADENISDKESAFIKRVFESTGIDALCIPEKTGFWRRIFG